MKNKRKKVIVASVLLLLLIFAAAVYFFYTPPLLDRRGYNLPGRAYDFFAYVYYSTSSDWLESAAADEPSRRAVARAAWHRPSRAGELLGIAPDDLTALAREYDSLGLEKEAVQLLKGAFVPLPGAENRALEIISSLAALGDWPGTAAAAGQLLAVSPDSPETEYWLGRALLETGLPDQAVIHLRRAYRLPPGIPDALFQIGRSEEARGEKEAARILYGRVVIESPDHRGAWEGLVRMCREEGEREKEDAALIRFHQLTPPVLRDRRIANKAILRGYRLPADEISGGEEIALELFLEGWRPGGALLYLGLRLLSDGSPEEWIRPAGTLPGPGPGEVLRVGIRQPLPRVLYPGEISLGVIFKTRKADSSEEVISGGPGEPPIARFRLLPAWTATTGREALIEERFGMGARSLGKGAFLAPGNELELHLDPPRAAAALGMVTYLHRGMTIPQGTTVGWVVVKTREEDDCGYPLIAGQDTAEVWWEYTPPWRRWHRPAPVFRSWPVESGGRHFRGGEYYTVFPFPGPLTVTGLVIKNSAGTSGFCVSDIVLIP